MSLTSVFDVSGSALSAQTVRLNATASNLANAQSVSSSVEETYRARHPVFASQMQSAFGLTSDRGALADNGIATPVQVLGVVESQAPHRLQYQPDHPYADDAGYVSYPNVNVVEEMANMMSASRSFQLNVEVMNTVRSLAERVLQLGQ